MDWFYDLTGLESDAPDVVRGGFDLQGDTLVSRRDGRQLKFGTLSTPSLGDFSQADAYSADTPSRFYQIVGDVGALHRDSKNAGALFQVASQFNLLEMISPDATPDDGIARYAQDRTQGPVCAMACGAGTLYRNYFVPVMGQVGQSAARQLDMAAGMAAELDTDLWEMRNGYLLASEAQLREIDARLTPRVRDALRIGVQWDTDVTGAAHSVTQAYCSALPVAYSSVPASVWEQFGRLVLSASYEACLFAAVQNKARTGNARVFLTMLGGGAFGNPKAWILDALDDALAQFAQADLEIYIVSYGARDEEIDTMLSRI